MSLFGLLLDSPLWIALIVVTVGLHVAFFVVVRRLSRARPPGESGEPGEPPEE
jgi:hypothetical protein